MHARRSKRKASANENSRLRQLAAGGVDALRQSQLRLNAPAENNPIDPGEGNARV
jgi:hypothetical protein